MTMSSKVNFDEIADQTEGFSGADLQALLYNAHLDVIHNSITEAPSISLDSKRTDKEIPFRYTTLGESSKAVLSKAEEMALQRRLRRILVNTSANKGTSRPDKVVFERKKVDDHIETLPRPRFSLIEI